MLVYDFGGGTLDVALLRLDPEQATFLVIDRAGDPHLGGEVRSDWGPAPSYPRIPYPSLIPSLSPTSALAPSTAFPIRTFVSLVVRPPPVVLQDFDTMLAQHFSDKIKASRPPSHRIAFSNPRSNAPHRTLDFSPSGPCPHFLSLCRQYRLPPLGLPCRGAEADQRCGVSRVWPLTGISRLRRS